MHLLAQLVTTETGIDIIAKVGWPGAVCGSWSAGWTRWSMP